MPAPIFRAVGAKVTATTTATAITAPAGLAASDLEIMVASTIAAGTITITAQGGTTWTVMTGSPIDVTAGEKLYVWWRFRSVSDTNPSLQATTDHLCACRLCYQAGTFHAASPFENVVTGTEVTSDTSFSFAPGGSTAGVDRLVCCIASSGADTNTHQVPVMTNASLTALNLRISDGNTLSGGGGGFGMTEGTLAAAGAVGTFACTYAGVSPKSYIAFAIRPSIDKTKIPTHGPSPAVMRAGVR